MTLNVDSVFSLNRQLVKIVLYFNHTEVNLVHIKIIL